MMNEPETGRGPLILHLSGGGSLQREVGCQLAEAGLRAEEFTDAYLAMGRLAGCAPTRVFGVVIDYAGLTDDVREFPRLVRSLVANSAVYVYGDHGAIQSDPAMTCSGARLVTTGEQVDAMVADLQRLMWRRHAAEGSAAAANGPEPGGSISPEPASRGDEQASSPVAEEAPDGELRVVEAASADINPEADALANAAAQRLPGPVLEVIEPKDEPIAKILPDLEQDQPRTEAPTPWSPSSRRPARTPPPTDRGPADDGAREADPTAERSDEPLLTPDELDALLGRPEQA